MTIPARFHGCIGCWHPGKHTHNGRGPDCPRWPYEATGAPETPRKPEAKPPMLDPDWTPERGYSHADRLRAILDAHDREAERVQRVDNERESV